MEFKYVNIHMMNLKGLDLSSKPPTLQFFNIELENNTDFSFQNNKKIYLERGNEKWNTWIYN